jgi:hypothetical protein
MSLIREQRASLTHDANQKNNSNEKINSKATRNDSGGENSEADNIEDDERRRLKRQLSACNISAMPKIKKEKLASPAATSTGSLTPAKKTRIEEIKQEKQSNSASKSKSLSLSDESPSRYIKDLRSQSNFLCSLFSGDSSKPASSQPTTSNFSSAGSKIISSNMITISTVTTSVVSECITKSGEKISEECIIID